MSDPMLARPTQTDIGCDGKPPARMALPPPFVPRPSTAIEAVSLAQQQLMGMKNLSIAIGVQMLPKSRALLPLNPASVGDPSKLSLPAKRSLKYAPFLDIYMSVPDGEQVLRVLAATSIPTQMLAAYSSTIRDKLTNKTFDQQQEIEIGFVSPSVLGKVITWMRTACSQSQVPIVFTRQLDWLAWTELFKATEDLGIPILRQQLLGQIKSDIGALTLVESLELFKQALDIGARAPRSALKGRIWAFVKGLMHYEITLEDLSVMDELVPRHDFTKEAITAFAEKNFPVDGTLDNEILKEASSELRERVARKWDGRRRAEERREAAKARHQRYFTERRRNQAAGWSAEEGRIIYFDL